MDLSSSPQELIHTWYCNPGQKPTAEEVIDHKEESINAVLLNGHVKMPHACRLMLILTVLREALFLQFTPMKRLIIGQNAKDK